MAAQFTYDAYGQVQTADHLLPHPFVRAGHKGLFADRLDAGVSDALAQGTEWTPSGGGAETPRLTPFATLVYDNRNRSYAPALGRFLQADPNATAMTLLEAASHSGRGLGAMVAAFDIDSRYGNGGNLFEYLGSAPWVRHDPSGTTWPIPSPADLGAVAVMGFARTLRGGLENMINVYADNQDADLDWAGDWSQPDDWHSRGDNSWVGEAWEDGTIAGFQEWIDRDVKDLVDPIGIRDWDLGTNYTGGGAVRQVLKAGRAIGRTVQRLHHALPKYLGRIIGKQSKVLARLTPSLHTAYHNHVSRGMKALGYPFMNAPRDEWTGFARGLRKAGISQAQLASKVKRDLVMLTKQFEKMHGLSGLSEAVLEAFE